MIVLLAALVPESALLALSLRATASTRSMQTLALSAVLVQEYVLLALLTLSDQRNTDKQFRYGNCLFFCLLIIHSSLCALQKSYSLYIRELWDQLRVCPPRCSRGCSSPRIPDCACTGIHRTLYTCFSSYRP